MKCKVCRKPVSDPRVRRHKACYVSDMFPRLKVRDDLTAYAGMLQKDVAAVLGVSLFSSGGMCARLVLETYSRHMAEHRHR